MSIESETAADQRIVESRNGRIAGMASRIGGALMVGIGGYLFARTGAAPALALAVPGAGVMGGGLRLGLERGAAFERTAQRQEFGGQVVVGITEDRKKQDTVYSSAGATAGTFIETVAAGLTGLEIGANDNPIPAFPVPFEIGTAAFTVGFAVAVEATIERAGRSTELKPRLHDILHLG